MKKKIKYKTFNECRDICNKVIRAHKKKYTLCEYFLEDTKEYPSYMHVGPMTLYEIKVCHWETCYRICIGFNGKKYTADISCVSTVTLTGDRRSWGEEYDNYIAECNKSANIDEFRSGLIKALNK